MNELLTEYQLKLVQIENKEREFHEEPERTPL